MLQIMNELCQQPQMNNGKIYAINNSVICVFYFIETSKVLWETFFLKNKLLGVRQISLSSCSDKFLFKNYDMEYCIQFIFQNCLLDHKMRSKGECIDVLLGLLTAILSNTSAELRYMLVIKHVI